MKQMTDIQPNVSSSYFAYANYWRPSASLGTTIFHSRSSKTMDKLEVKHKWQIVPIATCVIITVTLVIGIYNSVIYQNVSKSLSAVNLTLPTTAAAAATKVAAADSTTASGNTTYSTTTTAVTTSTVETTSLALSTDIVTTKTPPTCPSMLPFGDDAGDKKAKSPVETTTFTSFYLWGIKVDTGYLRLLLSRGIVQLKSGDDEENVLEVRILFGETHGSAWDAYYRNVSSNADQDAIACLVNNSQTGHTFVLTWVKNMTENNEEVPVLQFIIASFEQSGTYIIRIYSEYLPKSYESPVKISYTSANLDYEAFAEVKAQDVAGQRQIFDVSKALDEGQNLAVIEERKNCNIFIC